MTMAMAGKEFDGVSPELAEAVIAAMGPNTNPRLREVDLTTEEWLMGVEMINQVGQISDAKRNEGILLSDVIGLESLVDMMAHHREANETVSSSAILGPFYRENVPMLENGSSIIKSDVGGETVYMHGTVQDEQGRPIPGAYVDVWEDAPNGLYEQQDVNQAEYNLRGKFKTDKDGKYSLYCIRPTSYPIPHDGPAGVLLQKMDRHPFRPAHIHLFVVADGYRSLVTQLFDRSDQYITTDSVFAVKENLKIDFKPVKGEKYVYDVEFDISLPKSKTV